MFEHLYLGDAGIVWFSPDISVASITIHQPNPLFLTMKTIILSGMAILLMISCQQNETSSTEESVVEPEPSIIGAWEITGYTMTTPDSTWSGDAPYRSVILFSKNYYSVEIAHEERPSWPDRADGEGASAEEISNAYSGLTSNSGTYKIQGDSLIYTAVVAKYPNFMNDYPTYSVAVKLDGDNLTTTRVARNNPQGSVTTTHKRLE